MKKRIKVRDLLHIPCLIYLVGVVIAITHSYAWAAVIVSLRPLNLTSRLETNQFGSIAIQLGRVLFKITITMKNFIEAHPYKRFPSPDAVSNS